MGRRAQEKRRRAVEQRSVSWGTARLVQPLEVVSRSEFGRVDPDHDMPVAWFHDGQVTRELLSDGTTQPTKWRTL
jgi:hypothetical protein